MGESASLLLTLDVRQPSEDFEIGVAILNLHGVAVHYLVSGWEGFTAIRQSGRQTIKVELPSIHLFPGGYEISIWIALRGDYYDDAIHSAMRFEVEEGSVNEHPTYFGRFSKNTQVYVPSRWSLLDATSGIESNNG